jgi:hypothetical protein
MMENLSFHNESKHIDIRYLCIRNILQRGSIKLHYVIKDEQVFDVLIKSLSRVMFDHFQDNLGIVRKDLPQKGE